MPDDPEQAFVFLEKAFAEDLNAELEREHREDPNIDARLTYMSAMIGAALACNIEPIASFDVPISDHNFEMAWRGFRTAVITHITKFEVKHARRRKGYTVAFDATTKQKLRHYIDSIKQIVDRLVVDVRKKERLYDRINALIAEIDKDRTGFDVAMALSVEAADTGGKIFQKLKPALDSITKLFGAAHGNEQRALPAPPKLLAPPNAANADDAALDDQNVAATDGDIPF